MSIIIIIQMYFMGLFFPFAVAEAFSCPKTWQTNVSLCRGTPTFHSITHFLLCKVPKTCLTTHFIRRSSWYSWILVPAWSLRILNQVHIVPVLLPWLLIGAPTYWKAFIPIMCLSLCIFTRRMYVLFWKVVPKFGTPGSTRISTVLNGFRDFSLQACWYNIHGLW